MKVRIVGILGVMLMAFAMLLAPSTQVRAQSYTYAVYGTESSALDSSGYSATASGSLWESWVYSSPSEVPLYLVASLTIDGVTVWSNVSKQSSGIAISCNSLSPSDFSYSINFGSYMTSGSHTVVWQGTVNGPGAGGTNYDPANLAEYSWYYTATIVVP